VAPRHLKAIKDTGNQLLAAYDPNDSVGILDSYFPEASFFTEFERFDRHLEKLKRKGNPIHYLSICSPNYLHDAHIRFGLRNGANVICEKPLVLNPWNAEALMENEAETGNKVFTILQLRLHPELVQLKNKLQHTGTKHQVELTYITARGQWYYTSWKAEMPKSGGIATNIGIHFFDLLLWLFGPLQSMEVHQHTHDRAAGYLELQHAQVRWFMSINADTLPENHKKAQKRTFRSITIAGQEIEFSDGFSDLHTKSYEAVLQGAGFGIDTVLPAIEMVHQIRTAIPKLESDQQHPFVQLPQSPHPFQ